jgi:hypothetical protein
MRKAPKRGLLVQAQFTSISLLILVFLLTALVLAQAHDTHAVSASPELEPEPSAFVLLNSRCLRMVLLPFKSNTNAGTVEPNEFSPAELVD